MILLTLASKQIWPQVLAVAHLKPNHLFLLHTNHATESQGPAQRLKRFFDDSGLVPKGSTSLQLISDSDFDAIECQLDELQRSHQLPLTDCVVHFTGGNKLMAIAAFRWATERKLPCFYLERRNQLTWFTAPDGKMVTRTETLDPRPTHPLDPVALLRCQLDASEVERSGQTLTLSPAGQQLAEEELLKRLQNGNHAKEFLLIKGDADREQKDGDALEFTVAAALLKLGVHRVQRSLRLKVKSDHHVGTRLPHAEIDLLFTWDGRLWLVDCKDRLPAENLVENLRSCLPQSLPLDARQLLARIHNELSISQTKAMKEDLLAVREVGGLLGQVVCVRKAKLPEEVLQYARHNQIAIIQKSDLIEGLRTLLFPNRPANEASLAALAAQFQSSALRPLGTSPF